MHRSEIDVIVDKYITFFEHPAFSNDSGPPLPFPHGDGNYW